MAMFVASIFAVSAFAADIDVTSKVNKTGWVIENGKPGNVTIDGTAMTENFQNWESSTDANTLGTVLSQTVTGLENGKYTLELWANARVAWVDSPATDGMEEATYLVANNVEISMKVFLNPGLNNNATYVLEDVEVTDGTMYIGMVKKAAGSNWHSIQIKTLTFHASDDVALAAAKADLQAALDAANAVSATEALTAAIATAQGVYDASTDPEEVKAALAALKTATALAINTNSVAGASLVNPVVTNFVVNGTFDEAIDPWKTTTGAQNQALATNQQGAFTGRFYENWNGSNYRGKLYQTIENIPNGLYELSICAFVETFDASAQFVYANADKKALVAGAPTAYTVLTVVANNTIEVGFEQTVDVNRWCGIDNISLKYFGEMEAGSSMAFIAYEITKANAKTLLTEKMDPAKLAALEAELAKVVDTTSDEELVAAEAELAAVAGEAKASANFFASNKAAIDAMYSLMENTNVYTAEAYLAYKSIADNYLAQYEAGTLTATVDNPATIHGWHAEVAYDDMLLSAFGTNNFDTNLYINTWSGEGETDGSNFKVPFFEYWIGDGERLGATTKTATVTGLVPGQLYSAEAWVRVRATNGVAAADATGITLSVGDGEAVDITEGEVIGTSQFSHGVFTAYGVADAEGNLTINFNVLDGNNISWLSFKNVKYAPAMFPERSTADAPKYYTIASFNRGGVLTDVNGAAQHVTKNDNSYWYFTVADANGGVNICNLNGSYLNTDLTIGETAGVWYILPNGVNENGMSISKTNPISNSSCIDANNHNAGVGTWAPSASDWEGTTWVFAEVNVAEDIENLLAANVNNHAETPALGQYSTAAYNALAAAKETVSNPVEAAAAIKAFEASKNLPMFTIDSQKDYALGQSIYENEEGALKFKATDATDLSMLWAFDMTATEVGLTDKVVVRNVATGNLFWGASFISVIETEPAVEGDGVFMFKTEGTGSPVHAQQNGSAIVRWSSADANCVGGASTWTFTYVGNTYDLYDLSDIREAFEAQAMEFMAYGQSSMALYKLSALQAKYMEVMMQVEALYGQIYSEAKVLKSDVQAAMDLMTATLAEVKPVADYYTETYSEVYYDADDLLQTLDPASEEFAALDAVLGQVWDLSAVVTVAELEEKAALINEAVAAFYDLSEVREAFEAQAMDFMSFGQSSMALYSLSALQAKYNEVMMQVEALYGQIYEEAKVLKSDVVAAMELMTATKAEIEPVVAYYDATYKEVYFSANELLDTLEPNSEAWTALDAAIGQVFDCSEVTTVAELEAKVAVLTEAINNVLAGIKAINANVEQEIYDIHGRRVNEMVKGLYIVNGKKVVVK